MKRIVDFEKPANLKDLYDKYLGYFRSKLTSKIFRFEQDEFELANDTDKVVERPEEDHDEEEEEEEEEHAEKTDYERLTHDRFDKEKTMRIKVSRDATRSVFCSFGGFAQNSPSAVSAKERQDDIKLYDNAYMYALDMNYVYGRLHANRKYDKIVTSISGGIVVPNKDPVFRTYIDEQTGDRVGIQTGDFTSLYPKTMQFANICQSTAAYNSRYKIKVDEQLYEPSDESMFWRVASPIKINDEYIAACVFLVKPTRQTSITSSMIESVIQKRLVVKEQQERALKSGQYVEANILEASQLALKLLINTLYGIFLKPGYSTFRPFLAALVTYFGRVALVRFFLTIFHVLRLRGVDASRRGLLSGDTDSLFVQATHAEMEDIIAAFCAWPSNRGVYEIKFEKSLLNGIYLGKKNYILHGTKKNGTIELISKNTFKKNQSVPCKVLCEKFVLFVFEKFLFNDMCDDVASMMSALETFLREFASTDEAMFVHTFKMNKELAQIKVLSKLHKQMLKLRNEDPSRTFVAGCEISYAHYNFVFDSGPFYGPLDPKRADQVRYAEKEKMSTALIADYLDAYADTFAKHNIHVSRERSLVRDLKSMFEKFFLVMSQTRNIPGAHLLEEYFRLAYLNVFGHEFGDRVAQARTRQIAKETKLAQVEEERKQLENAKKFFARYLINKKKT